MIVSRIWTAHSLTGFQYRSFRSLNPGISKRLKIYKQNDPDLSHVKLKQSEFEDMEIDIMKPSLLKKEVEREYYKIRNKIALKRVERQYFGIKKNPNFLTSSEKEQIRQLHHSEPDKWTYDALAQSFPATSDIIQKIVKARWKFKTPEDIKKHDERVASNWKAFNDKKLDVPEQLRNHLTKFTGRHRLLPPRESTDLIPMIENLPDMPSTKSKVFVDIIQKYKNKGNDEFQAEVAEKEMESELSPPSETYVMGNPKRNNPHANLYTLDQMKEKGEIEIPDNSQLRGSTSSTLEESNTPKSSTGFINPSDFAHISKQSFKKPSDNVLLSKPAEDIPMKITIPKEKWKKGATYRVNNCFYADDGAFLYKI